jgi:MFS family permease
MAAVVYGSGLLEASGSSVGPSLVMAASFGALAIGTFFAGRMIGRFGARPVAIAGLWVSLAAAGLIAALAAMGDADPTIIAIIAAAGAILDDPAGVASETKYPQIARLARFDLVRLNAIDDGLDNTSRLNAPALGALVVSALGLAAGSAMIAIVTLLAATLCTASFPAFRTRSTGGAGVANGLRHSSPTASAPGARAFRCGGLPASRGHSSPSPWTVPARRFPPQHRTNSWYAPTSYEEANSATDCIRRQIVTYWRTCAVLFCICFTPAFSMQAA